MSLDHGPIDPLDLKDPIDPSDLMDPIDAMDHMPTQSPLRVHIQTRPPEDERRSTVNPSCRAMNPVGVGAPRHATFS
ncbi:unnamed protein product [Gadus morhua 'NCC']